MTTDSSEGTVMRTESTQHRQGWTLVLASLGVFMVALDTLVVATALPVLRTDFGASLGDLEWTVNAYNLSFACCLITGAALGDRWLIAPRDRLIGHAV